MIADALGKTAGVVTIFFTLGGSAIIEAGAEVISIAGSAASYYMLKLAEMLGGSTGQQLATNIGMISSTGMAKVEVSADVAYGALIEVFALIQKLGIGSENVSFLSEGINTVLHGDGGGSSGGGDESSKIITSSDNVVYNQRSVDHAFSKHSSDFGNYPDGSKASVNQFANDIKNLVDSGVQKAGTYHSMPGTHIYNPDTMQWVFINSDGSFNAAFKLSVEQFKYLLETGVVK